MKDRRANRKQQKQQRRENRSERRREEREVVARKRRELIQSALEQAELADEFARLDDRLQKIVCTAVTGEPQLTFSESTLKSVDQTRAEERFQQLLDNNQLRKFFVESPGLLNEGVAFPISAATPRQFLRVLFPLEEIVTYFEAQAVQNGIDLRAGALHHLDSFKEKLRRYNQLKGEPIFYQLQWDLFDLVAEHTQLDTRIFSIPITREYPDKGSNYFQFDVRSTTPQQIKITVDGERRPAFRCTLPQVGTDFTELSWPGSACDVADLEMIPVYIQSHAWKQLRDRIPCVTVWSIVDSLLDPVFYQKRDDGRLLVEYRWNEWKLGYFVVSMVDGVALLRTFLFLTMRGTPESELLYQKLDLARHDIQHLALDNLSTFLDPEFRDSAEFRLLFAACGCSSLFEFDPQLSLPPSRFRFTDLQQYLSRPGASNQLRKDVSKALKSSVGSAAER